MKNERQKNKKMSEKTKEQLLEEENAQLVGMVVQFQLATTKLLKALSGRIKTEAVFDAVKMLDRVRATYHLNDSVKKELYRHWHSFGEIELKNY